MADDVAKSKEENEMIERIMKLIHLTNKMESKEESLFDVEKAIVAHQFALLTHQHVLATLHPNQLHPCPGVPMTMWPP